MMILVIISKQHYLHSSITYTVTIHRNPKTMTRACLALVVALAAVILPEAVQGDGGKYQMHKKCAFSPVHDSRKVT